MPETTDQMISKLPVWIFYKLLSTALGTTMYNIKFQ